MKEQITVVKYCNTLWVKEMVTSDNDLRLIETSVTTNNAIRLIEPFVASNNNI